MARLILVRHGETRLYHEHRFCGKTDVELNNAGIRQSERLRDRLAGEKIKTIYCSTLKRARATAEIISVKHGLNVQPCAELNECNFGYVEGLTFMEIKKQYPELAEKLDRSDTVIQFPGGESFNEMDKRVKSFFKRLAAHNEEDIVVAVGHASPLVLLVCHLLEIPVEHWRKMRLDPASVSVVDTYAGGVILSSLNDTSHLRKQEVQDV